MVRLSTVLGFAFVTASVFIPGVLSQDLSPCGNICAQQAASTSGCNVSDFNCLCTDLGFADSFGTCLGLSCSPADAETSIDSFYSSCEGLSVPNPPVVSDPSVPTDTSTPTDISSPESTVVALPTSTPATGPSATASPASTRSPASIVSPTTRTSPTPPPSPTSKTSNHATHNRPASVLGAAFALALVLFA